MTEQEQLCAILQKALAGDQEAYRTFLQAVAEQLRADSVNEEVVQDVLIALHQKRDLYRPGTPVMEWVHLIARHHGVRFEDSPGPRGIKRWLSALWRRNSHGKT